MTTPDDEAVRQQTMALALSYQTLLTEQRFDEWMGTAQISAASPIHNS